MPSSPDMLFQALEATINEAKFSPSEDLALRVALLMGLLERVAESPSTFRDAKATMTRSGDLLQDAFALALAALDR